MNSFDYFQPTNICFGAGRFNELAEIVGGFGKRCLLVTVPEFDAFKPLYDRTKKLLQDGGIDVAHFDGVVPNPTTDCITEGAKIAKEHKSDVVLGLGGGSSMDAAKAIAVEATHEGSCWEYLFFKNEPTEKTLPMVAVSTTSGTGSQVTQVSVVTHTATRDKSALYHPIIFPKVAIVDPELMVTVPEHVTASTGFDAFCHAFEASLCPNCSPYVTLIAWDAIQLVFGNLETVLSDPANMDSRGAMAWADTLAGLCIANAGVTMPHGIGMAIGGMYPHVMHGETLAINYPSFTRFTYESAVAGFAKLGRSLNPSLANESDATAAMQSCEELDAFMKKIGMWISLKDMNVPENELEALAKQAMVLPDYENNPRVATAEEMLAIIKDCYER